MNDGGEHPLDLRGRSYLVTGAASGIGRATAVRLSRLGARLICSDLEVPGLEETLGGLRGSGHIARPFDLRNVDAVASWLGEACSSFGQLNGFVHAAGVPCVCPVKGLGLDRLREVILVNAESGFALAKAFVNPRTFAGSQGSIVFISSVMSLVGSAASAGYAMSKGALNSLTRALALEYANRKIRVNAVAPGFVKTPMFDKTSAGWDDEQRRRVEALHALGFGEPEDIANAAAFLLADESRWITGTVMVVDGGYSAQ
ncbi:MAG TPA: SDR family oxidoreductase [Candidatus Aminicenantes bacterium]|nr:SDR family oxidoreductase [Candidatus Aminicenantes bacterium]HRY65736.1 SDR family oxidoreductase [Candidatus Aminicenantes bacterium]HRZ72650.1 SDR family oxidoreductase [Candidatus Aminicenantes bacterium]